MSHDLLTYQFVILFIATTLVARKLLLVIKHRVSGREFLVTTLIWAAFATFSLFPNIITLIGKTLGFELGINALLVVGIITLFYLVLNLSIKIDRTEQNITKLVRAEALKGLQETKAKK